jgi:hypothetical protein
MLGMYFFMFVSGASGQQFFNDAIYILYSVMFTALPILFLAIFDRGGLNRNSLENTPKIYLSIAHGGIFNDSKFFHWILRALWNIIYIYFLIWATLGENDVVENDGRTNDLWFLSTVAYTAIVLLVTVRILFEAQSINVFIFGFTMISFLGYFFVVEFANQLLQLNPNLYGVFDRILSSPTCWLVLMLAIAFPLLIDVALWSWQRSIHPTFVDVLQERQRLNISELEKVDRDSATSFGSQHSSARVRTRAVPYLSQQQKDEALLHKIRRALKQAHQESARQQLSAASTAPGATSGSNGIDDAGNSQRRAEALVYTMTRLQNLSGANLDATPQRGILSLYETTHEKLTPAQTAALKEREIALAAEVTREHEYQQRKESQLAKAAEEARQRALEQEDRQQRHNEQRARRHHRRRSSAGSGGGGSAHEPVLQLGAAEEDEEELSDAEQEELEMGIGRGRVHTAHTLDDNAIELSISDNKIELDDDGTDEHFVFDSQP